MTGTNFSSWYNQSQGTLYVETNTVFGTGICGAASFNDGSVNNSISIYGSLTGSYMESLVSGASVVTNYTTGLTHYPYKNIYSYLANNTATTFDGATPLVDTSCAIPTVNKIVIGALYTGSSFFLNGHIRKINYYSTALPSATLQALTS